MARKENGLVWSSKDPKDIHDLFAFPLYIYNLTDDYTIKIKNAVIEDFSETPSAPIFNSYEVLGRSSPPQSYSGGETRTISFTLKMHRDEIKLSSESATSDRFKLILDSLKALNYPKYSSSGVVPPKVFVKYGDAFQIKGFATVTMNYKRPYDKYKRPIMCDVSISISEVLKTSMDIKQVRKGKYVTKDSDSFR